MAYLRNVRSGAAPKSCQHHTGRQRRFAEKNARPIEIGRA